MTNKLEIQKKGIVSILTSPYFYLPVLYLILALLVLDRYQYLMYKDEIMFICVAEKFAAGDFLNAPNALWPPLMPFLLSILIRLGLPTPFAAKLLCLMIGVFTILSAILFSNRFEMSDWLRKFLLLLFVPVVLYSSLMAVSADVLLTGLFTLYFSIIFSREYATRPYAGYLCGVLGALTYFCKTFAFFFFIVHFLLLTLWHYAMSDERAKKTAVLRQCVGSLVVFAVLCAGWVYMLNRKYHEVTIGVAGSYNLPVPFQGRPTNFIGFVEPPYPTTLTIWEEPYYLRAYQKRWSPLASWGNFKRHVKLIIANIGLTIDFYQRFSVISMVVISAWVLLCMAPLRILITRFPFVLSLITVLLYPIGYILIHIEERYLWPVYLLVLFMAGHLLHLLFKTQFFASKGKKALALVLFASSFLLMPLTEMYLRANAGKDINTLAKMMVDEGLTGSNIASENDYGAAVIATYYLKAKYYGTPEEKTPEDIVVEQLRSNKIDYYLVFGSRPVQNPGLVKFKELEAGGRSVSVYAVKY